MEVIIMNFKLFTKYSNIEMLLLTNLGFFFFLREYQNVEQLQVFCILKKIKNLQSCNTFEKI